MVIKLKNIFPPKPKSLGYPAYDNMRKIYDKNQFAELDIKLNSTDLKILKEKGYIDCNCEISVRIKLPKKKIR